VDVGPEAVRTTPTSRPTGAPRSHLEAISTLVDLAAQRQDSDGGAATTPAAAAAPAAGTAATSTPASASDAGIAHRSSVASRLTGAARATGAAVAATGRLQMASHHPHR